MLRIGCGLEDALLEFLIHFLLLVLFCFEKSFEFLHVTGDRVRRIAEAERNEVGVGHAHNSRAAELGKRAAIDELGVGKMCVPVEIVVDRVIDNTSTFAADCLALL